MVTNGEITVLQKKEKKNVASPFFRSGNHKKHVDRDWLKLLIASYNTATNANSKDSNLDKNGLQYGNDKALIVAPMVEQSDLPFRLLCRKYGANLAFTPMIHARYFVTKQSYREKMWKKPADMEAHRDDKTDLQCLDKPIIAQICGSNKRILLKAAKILENDVDAIDLNCGCPTKTAKRGRYGAFLLQSDDFLVDTVQHLAENLSCPLTVKVRLLPDKEGNIDLEKSLLLYEKLVNAGASMLTIHGRTRFQKGADTGKANWDCIRQVVEKLGERIPIIANGNIQNLDDVRECFALTSVDGVMSSESILEYPPLYTESNTKAVNFKRTGPGRHQIAREYLDLCQLYPPDKGGGGTGMQCVRMHIDTFLHEDWKYKPDLRETMLRVSDISGLYEIVQLLEDFHHEKGHRVENEQSSWYLRHR